jgi:hypothetical protein
MQSIAAPGDPEEPPPEPGGENAFSAANGETEEVAGDGEKRGGDQSIEVG